MWHHLFDFHAELDELKDRIEREDGDRDAIRTYVDVLKDNNRQSWSVDNPSTRFFTLQVDDVQIEIRYTRNQYWRPDSDYYNTWDAYYIENLPKALSDSLYSFVVESAMVVNRTLGYAMGPDGPYREDPSSPDEHDVKWINEGQRSALEERMGIRKKQRGGQRRLDWPDERKIAFLEMYDTMKWRVKEAAGRVRQSDPVDVRISVLHAANSALPEAQRLPARTLHSLVRRADQISVDRRSAPSLAILAMEATAEMFGVLVNDYLWKILTSARKIRTEQHLGRANAKAANESQSRIRSTATVLSSTPQIQNQAPT